MSNLANLTSLTNLEYIIRIVVAGFCGILVGYERRNRMKEAGVRTHFIVALGSALIMVVSKYGFQDLAGWQNISLDPSRVAAQIVSGIGFLGAGMIVMQGKTVKGLTTAAGIWATAGVGMAIGSGLYIIGLSSSIIIVIAQTILHKNSTWLKSPKTEDLYLKIDNNENAVKYIQKIFKQENVTIIDFKANREDENEDEYICLEISAKFPASYDVFELVNVIQKQNFIKCIEM